MKITPYIVLTADAFTPIKMEPNLTLTLSAGPYQVSTLLIPGSGMVVSSTEIGIVQYQILPHSHVALKYLCIPSTSVASEHLFSKAGKCISK